MTSESDKQDRKELPKVLIDKLKGFPPEVIEALKNDDDWAAYKALVDVNMC
jgi:hypothetical protein